MNEASPWNRIIAKQQLEAMRREEEERIMKEELKLKYHQELRNQIEQARQKKRQQQEKEKYQDKMNIFKSQQNQKVAIQMGKTKVNNEQLMNSHGSGGKQQIQKEKQKIEKSYQQYVPRNNSENNILKKNDYSISEQKNIIGRSLIDRKREQWAKDKISSNFYEDGKQSMDEEKRLKRFHLQNHYNEELKKQIQSQQNLKKASSRNELQKDKYLLQIYKDRSHDLYSQRKAYQRKNKKQLWETLESQIKEKQKTKYNPYEMQRRQFQMNAELLKNAEGIVPGETYNIDPQRKKQFETIVRSLSPGKKNGSEKLVSSNYLMSRGRDSLI